MCLAVLVTSAGIGAARWRDDEDQIPPHAELAEPSDWASAFQRDMVQARDAAIFCDGQHCDIGTAASVEPDDGSQLSTALWLLSHPDHLPVQPLEDPEAGVPADEGQPSPAPLSDVLLRLRPVSGVDWAELLSQFNDWEVATMLRIIACESGGDPNAISPGGQNWGAFQLNVVHGYSVVQMTDPVTSTALAHDVWLSQGYRAWSCY